MMKSKWWQFFKPGSEVFALPGWEEPRLLIPVNSVLDEYQAIAAHYSAFTLPARLHKAYLQVRSKMGLHSTRKSSNRTWALEGFLGPTASEVLATVLVIGRPTPIQKVKVVLYDQAGRMHSCLKYGETELAKKRIVNEWRILKHVPGGLGPSPIKQGNLLGGLGILESAVSGKKFSARLPPDERAIDFVESIPRSGGQLGVHEHPWITELLKSNDFPNEGWLSSLEDHDWDVVLQHGDFAPWNLYKDGASGTIAIDWEFGKLRGFPWIDLTNYILQVAALVMKWNPEKAFHYARDFISARSSLRADVSASLVRLAAYEAHETTLKNGRSNDWPLQRWRQEVWQVRA